MYYPNVQCIGVEMVEIEMPIDSIDKSCLFETWPDVQAYC